MRLALLLAAAWVAAVAFFVAGLERPAPLFVNVGAGDAPFARGFRERWERDGLTGSGETTFRWAADGSRLEVPVSVASGRLTARVRLARFAATPAEVTVEAGGREVDRWVQAPRGWRVREIDLGEARGPLALTFRAPGQGGDGLALAVDWVEVRGAGAVRPSGDLALRLTVFLLAPPLLVLLVLRAPTLAAGVGAFGAMVAALAVWRDRLGGLWACSAAAAPAVVAVVSVALLYRVMRRAWPDAGTPCAAGVPLFVTLAALVAFFHPFYYYPDVDTHARFLQALRVNPSLLVDPTQPWQRRGDVTREIGGQRVPIPYAMVFHASAWPLTAVLPDTAALKTAAVVSAAAVVLLVHPLARATGLGPGWSVVAQILAALLPVLTSRLSLALYPTLFGQAWLVLLVTHLARRLSHLDGARDSAAATLFMFLAEATYTGSLLMVSTLVLVLSAVELLSDEWRRSLRLLGGWGIATGILLLTMYVGFLPTLWAGVLPYVFEDTGATVAAAGEASWLSALRRLAIFYDVVFPILTLAGLAAMWRRSTYARRVLGSALLAGVVVLLLRFVLRTALRDAKEVELLWAPVAVLSASALAWAWARGLPGRAMAVLALAVALGWSLLRDVSLYAERFLAVGR